MSEVYEYCENCGSITRLDFLATTSDGVEMVEMYKGFCSLCKFPVWKVFALGRCEND
ncbi:MAG: hypothetical protein Q8M92_01880 [Candidatus Subteraquimicrobiales bacterium]|nr:hypothetical protein [Candidatus Subteraquimicrobiales bacterium]